MKKAGIIVEHMSEASLACMLAMTQGNILAFTLSHWTVALQTGVLAGALASGLLIFRQIRKPRMASLIVGSVTTAVDIFVHGELTSFGSILEAIATGAMAGALALLVSLAVERRSRRTAQRPGTDATQTIATESTNPP